MANEKKSTQKITGLVNAKPISTEVIGDVKTVFKKMVRGNIIRIDSQDGYSKAFVSPALQQFTIPAIDTDVTPDNAWEVSKKRRDDFMAINAAALKNASDTRKFLQTVIDNANADEIIMFPENKTFVIDFDPMGYCDGYANGRVAFDPYKIADLNYGDGLIAPEYYNKVKFVGLNITHKVVIDLNGSTIKFVPNWLPNFNVVYVGVHDMYAGWGMNGMITTDPSGTIIRNGKIDASKEWAMYFPVHARTYKNKVGGDANFVLNDYEHGHALSASRKVILEDLEVCNAVGDGLCISSDYRWCGTLACDTRGIINKDGFVIPKSSGGSWYSHPAHIEPIRNAGFRVRDIVARPAHDSERKASKVDITPFYVSEFYTVAYYKGEEFVGMETLQFGDNLHIPDGATHFRFGITIDPNEKNVGIMLCSITWSYGTKVEGCYIHDCGRDGMTLACMKNSLIRNCRIARCTQAHIDIESTAYLDNDLHIEGLIIDHHEDGAIKSVTGDHLMLTRSSINGVMSSEPYIHISDCDLQWLRLGAEAGSLTETGFNSNISKPKRIVRDCIIRGDVECTDTIFENCVFCGDFLVFARNQYNGKYPNVFRNCTFKVPSSNDAGNRGLVPGKYYDCDIRCDGDLNLQMYWASKPELSKYVFRGCTFDVRSIYTANNYGTKLDNTGTLLDIENCEFNIRGHYNLYNFNVFSDKRNMQIKNANFAGSFLQRLVNSVINFAPNNSDYFEFFFTPYCNAAIAGNTFNPTASASKVSFIKLYLRAAVENDVHDVSIVGNKVNYYGDARFVFVHQVSEEDDVQVNILDNTFIDKTEDKKGELTDLLLFDLGKTDKGSGYQDQDFVSITPSIKSELSKNKDINKESISMQHIK